jgi:hypothetical protein
LPKNDDQYLIKNGPDPISGDSDTRVARRVTEKALAKLTDTLGDLLEALHAPRAGAKPATVEQDNKAKADILMALLRGEKKPESGA